MTTSSGLGLPFRIWHDAKVPMRDGVLLSADIYLPFSEGPFPTLLLRTPYNKQEARYIHEFVPRFVQNDYAVVMQDCRGRHDSDGEWYPYVNEPKDGYDTQQWIGAQPWCDGNLGTFGGSYVGFTQVMSAPLRSPYVKGLFPSGSQETNYGMVYMDGLFHMTMGQWFMRMGTGRTQTDESRSLMNEDELKKRLPLISAFDDICDIPSYKDAIRHYTYDELWKSYGVKDKYGEIDTPAYFITGWYDALIHDNFRLFNGWRNKARSAEARKLTRLLVGPWYHMTIGSAQPFNDFNVGPTAGVDVVAEHLRWYDRRLKGIDNSIDDEPPLRLFIMGENVWRDEHEWPLARTLYTDYYLHSGGRANSLHGNGVLFPEPPSEEPPDHYRYNPDDPVPTMGGPINHRNYAGPRDRRPAERRDDVLVYTSEPLRDDIEVTGSAVLTLYASSTAPDTDFVATLVDVHPDGKAINITEGALRARFRESLENPTLIEAARVYEYKINVWETSNLFKAGHRIRLEVSSSNFPRFDRNLNTGHQPGLDADVRTAEQTVYHDSRYPSRVTLPIIPR